MLIFNFFFYIFSFVLSLSMVLTVFFMYFIGVSGLRVFPLLINGWNGYYVIEFWLVFTARLLRIARIMCGKMSVRPSVRPYVCLSHAGILSKRLNVS